MPTFPKSILIAGHRVRIRFTLTGENLGEWDGDAKTIDLHKDLAGKPTQAFETIAHEAVHAVFFFSGTSFSLTDDEEEVLVRMLESLLFPVFRRLIAAENRAKK